MAADTRRRRRYYPAFLDLEGKPCLVVGGGKVAERKVLMLLKCGGRVKVVSPDLTPKLLREKSSGRIRHIGRKFRKSDTRGTFLVIAATDSEEENARVAGAAGSLLNVVDTPALCNFIVPSVVDRGPLTIAISTSGASPAMAKAIRKELGAIYGKDLGAYLEILRRLRRKAVARVKDRKHRERLLKDAASCRVLDALKGG